MLQAQELERITAKRMRTWDDLLYHEYLVSQIPLRSPYWRRAWISGMAATGARLARWGEWLAQRAYEAGAPTGNEFANRVD